MLQGTFLKHLLSMFISPRLKLYVTEVSQRTLTRQFPPSRQKELKKSSWRMPLYGSLPLLLVSGGETHKTIDNPYYRLGSSRNGLRERGNGPQTSWQVTSVKEDAKSEKDTTALNHKPRNLSVTPIKTLCGLTIILAWAMLASERVLSCERQGEK